MHHNKFIEKLVLVIAIAGIVFLYGAYKSYKLQMEEYEANIALHIQGVCVNLIRIDFGQHTSLLDFSESKHRDFGIKSNFTIYNDLLSLTVTGRSTLYFADYAPQEIICSGWLPYNAHKKVTKNTQFNFFITLPEYLPQNYNGYLLKHSYLTLTIKEMEEIAPMIKLFPLDKPSYNPLSFYLNKLNNLMV